MDYEEMQTTALVRLAQARAQAPAQAREALGELCTRNTVLVRNVVAARRGRGQDLADLVQGFFLELFSRGVDSYDRDRGRFRPWLAGAVRNFLLSDSKRRRAAKRAVDRAVSFEDLSLAQRAKVTPRDERTPERLHESARARIVIDRALAATRAQYAEGGPDKLRRFELLEPFIIGGDLDTGAYEQAARHLEISRGAARKAVFDLRACYRAHVRLHLHATES